MEPEISEPITLTFAHTEKEYVAATRVFYARVYHTRFYMVVSGIVLILGVVLILLTLEFIFGSMIAVAALILLVFNFYAHFVTPRQFFQRNAKFRQEFNLQFSEDGLLFRFKGGESKLAWTFYSMVWETPRFYFLRYDNSFFTLIPKRVFTSEAQESVFRDLLSRKIGDSEIQQSLARDSGEFQGDYRPPQNPPDWR